MERKTVLLVDDETAFVQTMGRRLDKRGLTVRLAQSGKEALEVLGADPSVDVVVLDVLMPGMDGLETLRRIKSFHPLVHVIMLTGHGTVDSAIEGLREGAYDYLVKPCELEILLQRIEQARDSEPR